MLKTKGNETPKWHWMLSFIGFVIALNWIFLLANEMVGLLQALGTIFDISEAIMGLTIFALVINMPTKMGTIHLLKLASNNLGQQRGRFGC